MWVLWVVRLVLWVDSIALLWDESALSATTSPPILILFISPTLVVVVLVGVSATLFEVYQPRAWLPRASVVCLPLFAPVWHIHARMRIVGISTLFLPLFGIISRVFSG